MTAEPASTAMDHVGAKILVVDDEKRNRGFLRRILEIKGYEVVEAENGEEALQLVVSEEPHVVLLDVLMPGIDGIEVCRRIRSDPKTASVPVLMITALTERNDMIAGIEAGANDFLPKPVDKEEVLLRVRNAARGKRMFDELQAKYKELQDAAQLRDNLTRMILEDTEALSEFMTYVASRGGQPEGQAEAGA